MATLMIRNLDEDVKSRLRVQAAEHGHSMEAEARALLTSALAGRRPTRGSGSYLRDQFAEIGGAELPIPFRDEPARAAQTRPMTGELGDLVGHQRGVRADSPGPESVAPD